MVTHKSWAEEAAAFNKEAFIKSASIKKRLELGMIDCIAMALKNNSEIQVKKITPLIEDANVKIQKARFEPDLSFDFTMEDNTDLSSTTLSGRTTTKTKTDIFNFGYGQKLVSGTKLDINFYNTRTRSNSIIQNLNPEFNSEAEVTITQPLLKGFGLIVNKADFLIAKNNKLKSNHDLAEEVINILTDIKKSYYDFQYNQEQYKAALISLKRVQDLYDINKEKYAKGLTSNVDLLQSEAEVARFEEAVLAAKAVMDMAEDNLKLITNIVDDPELWNASIVLLENLTYEKEAVDLIDAIKKAFDHRPDYEGAKVDLKSKDISVIYYRNGMLPTLDLVGSYGLNGLGKNYEKDLSHIGGGKYPDWVVGVSVKMPLGSDEEKGNYEKSKLTKKQALIGFKRLEQKIMLEVRNAIRNVDTSYRMIEASIKARDAERENYEAQGSRFNAGLVSTLDIITYQERLTRAEVNFIKSVIDYKISLAELARAEGMTLINDNIKME